MLRNTRTPLACARCYKRKKGCDRKYPSCTQCTKARAQCIGLDRGSQAELPRSLLTHLETLVSQLEARKEGLGGGNNQVEVLQPIITDSEQTPLPMPESQRCALAHALAATTAQTSTPILSMETNERLRVALPYHRAFFMGAELPYPLAFQAHRPINFPSNHNDTEHTKLPEEVAEKLIAVYSERILPQFPLFLKGEVLDMFHRFSNNDATPDERFIILMMEAIATIASKSRDYRKSVGLAESLRRDAFGCIDFGLSCHLSAMITIQKLLLLAQYGFYLPSSTNLWQIVGDATRIALELGLHHDTPVQADVDETCRESRKRLFWALYSIDRSVAITSHRPYSIAGDEICATVPQFLEGIDTADSSHVRFMDKLQFLRLQAEVCSVNIGMRPIPDPAMTHESWMASIDQRISEIKAQTTGSQGGDLLEWQSLLLLHMPCRRNPSPDDKSVLKAFGAAVCIANGYWDLVQLEHVEYPWHATHHCYEAGILILYSLWHFAALVRENYTTKQIFEVVHQISGFFILIDKQWPAAQQCGVLFDGLRKGALTYFREEGSSDLESNKEAKQLKDLVFRENADLLYARDQFHLTQQPQLASGMQGVDLQGISPLDFTTDLEFLDFFSFPETSDLQGLDDILMDDAAQGTEFMQASDSAQTPDVLVSEGTIISEVDNEQMKIGLQNLPVCSHCKKRRIKCDVELPACRSCTKLKRECFFWDTALSQQTSRKRIDALKRQVEALVDGLENGATQTHSPQPLDLQIPWIATDMSLPEVGIPASICTILCTGSPSVVFFGPTSAFARLATEAGRSLPLPMPTEVTPSSSGKGQSSLIETIMSCVTSTVARDVPQSVAEDLVSLYYRSIEICYPIVGQTLIRQVLDQVYDKSSGPRSHGLHRIQLNLMLAISLALMSSQDQRLRLGAKAYFHQAISEGLSADEFVNPTNTSLQLVLLLCIYAWICPRALDIWRLIGHASRMCLDMVEVHGSDKTESATTGTLYRTLYALESHFALAFGRPRHLPDRADVPASSSSSDLNPISGAGDLSTLVYDLARLQNRFHKDMIGRDYPLPSYLSGNALIDPILPDQSWMASCVYEIKAWLENWNAQVESEFALQTFEQAQEHGQDLTRQLKCWGQFQQCQALLLAKTATYRRGQVLISSTDELVLCREILEAAEGLVNSENHRDCSASASASQFVFPLAWTHAHGIFNTIVAILRQPYSMEIQDLFEQGIRILASAGKPDNQGTAGLVSCLRSIHGYVSASGTT